MCQSCGGVVSGTAQVCSLPSSAAQSAGAARRHAKIQSCIITVYSPGRWQADGFAPGQTLTLTEGAFDYGGASLAI